jgi:protein TonB
MNTSSALPAGYLSGHRFSIADLVIVVGVHVAVVFALMALDVLPLPPSMATLMVRMVAPGAPQPEVTPPRPKPVAVPVLRPPVQRQPEPLPEPPLLASAAPAPAVAEIPLLKEAPPPPAEPSPAPVVQPVAIIEPRFDAAYLDNPAPVYPPLSKREGEQGTVILRVFVEAGGRPSQLTIRSSSGYPRLDRSAVDTVGRWKFIPARRGDAPVAAWVLVPVDFHLRN